MRWKYQHNWLLIIRSSGLDTMGWTTLQGLMYSWHCKFLIWCVIVYSIFVLWIDIIIRSKHREHITTEFWLVIHDWSSIHYPTVFIRYKDCTWMELMFFFNFKTDSCAYVRDYRSIYPSSIKWISCMIETQVELNVILDTSISYANTAL